MKHTKEKLNEQATKSSEGIAWASEGSACVPHAPRGGKSTHSANHGNSDQPKIDQIVSEIHELPLSNKLITVRANRKMGVSNTGGTIEEYPSMLVRKRDRGEWEEEYYAMIARFGKKSRISGSKRGQIDHFSNASRYRMLKKLGSIGREDPPYMVTLTYRSGSVTLDQAKKDLKKLRSRLDREYGKREEITEPYIKPNGLPALRKRYKYKGTWAGSWRFEVTTGRGKRAKSATPHFHILVWCEDWHDMDLRDLDETISSIWCEVTGDGGEDRMKYGCRIDQSFGDQAKIKNYMLGHHGKKTEQEVIGGGRHWGVINEELLRIGEPTAIYYMTADQRRKYDRITSRLIAKRTKTGECRDHSDLKETHVVLRPYDVARVMKHLGVRKSVPDKRTGTHG